MNVNANQYNHLSLNCNFYYISNLLQKILIEKRSKMPFRKRTKSKKAYNKKSSSNTKNNEQKQILLKNSSIDENDIGVVLCKLNDIKENARNVLLNSLRNVSIFEKIYRYIQLIVVAPFIIVVYISLYSLLKIFPFIPFPSFLPVGVKNIFGRGSLKDVVTTDVPNYKSEKIDGEQFVEVKNMNWEFPWKQDNGLYWYGKGNVCSKMKKILKNTDDKEEEYELSEFFDPTKPSMIYIHGYSPGTTKRGFRETINWREKDKGLFKSTNTLDLWIEKGYNCGIFYWNSQADELDVKVAERKIYSENGKEKMRYLVRGGEDGKSFWYEPGLSSNKTDDDIFMINDKSIALQFYYHYYEHFMPRHVAPIHIVGHSLGCQIALASIKIIRDRSLFYPLPTRLTLLDPFCSKVCANNFKQNLQYVANNIVNDKVNAMVIETYATSIIGEGFLISHTPVRLLKKLTYYNVINSSLIPWYSIKWRHICVLHYYFSSIVFDMDDYHNKNETWNTSIPHAGASLEMIRQRMGK